MERIQIVSWAPIPEGVAIPPFGEALERHILSYSNPARRNSSCAAWSLLYRELTKLDIDPSALCFTGNGKPFFRDQTLFFSLSHSGKLCAVSLSDRPTGVDLEQLRPAYDPRLIARVLSSREMEEYKGDFVRFWCRKEASLKLSGEGKLVSVREIDTLNSPYLFEEQTIPYQGEAYFLTAAFSR